MLLALASCSHDQELTKWVMHQEGSKEYYNVKVPTTVAGALNEAGVWGKGILEEDRYFSIHLD